MEYNFKGLSTKGYEYKDSKHNSKIDEGSPSGKVRWWCEGGNKRCSRNLIT